MRLILHLSTFRIYILLAVLTMSWACNDDKRNVGPRDKNPNILFIMTDDHTIQALSAYGHPLSKLAPTPNIDRIAENGALFRNSFCTNAICGPSRAVILTGKHSHVNGFRMNGEQFDGSQPTLPKYLRSMGYNTAVIGKWHLHGQPTGFDYWDIINDQGNYYNPEFIRAGDSAVVEGYVTDIITEKSLDWLKSREGSEQPFFLMLHHKAPHRNWMPAPRHLNLYDTVRFPLPDTYFPEFVKQQAAEEQQQTIYRDMYEGYDLKLSTGLGSDELAHNPWVTDFERMTPAQREVWDQAYRKKNDDFHKADLHGEELAVWKGQRYLQDYLATVAAVDESVGQVLDYLEQSGLDDNTLVIYTSDQGFYLGEKGWFDKRFMYEESLRIPLLMQYPGHIKPGSEFEGMVQNLDFAPTMLEYAGADSIPSDIQGRSFRELLDANHNKGDFRDLIYYHYYDYPAFHMVKKQYGIRSNRYKLIHFYDDIDSWEFYDLEKDSVEMNNLIDAPEYQEIISKMYFKLDSIQEVYKVTEKEFEKAPPQKVENAYRNFKRLRGTILK